MKKTIFLISKLDCQSEEQIIKMNLQGISNISKLVFNLKSHYLYVYHSGDYKRILTVLDSLNFGSQFVSTEETDDQLFEDTSKIEKRVLLQSFSINFFFFVLELIAGFLANSMGLIADGLDMLADAMILALSLFVVGGTVIRKKQVAKAAGYFQMILLVFGVFELIRRFIGITEVPNYMTMIVISAFALIGNALSLYLIQKAKSKEAHFKASIIFLSNDVIINIGVIITGVIVFITNSKYPDLIIGAIVYIMVLKGVINIFKLSR